MSNSPKDQARYPAFLAFGGTPRKLTHAETIAASRDERIQGIWWFVVEKVNAFYRSQRSRERANYDPEDVLMEMYILLAKKDALWQPDVATYITFAGTVIHHELEEIRSRSRIVHSPRNAVSRLRDYEKKGDQISPSSVRTRAAIRRTMAEPAILDRQSQNPHLAVSADHICEPPDEVVAERERIAQQKQIVAQSIGCLDNRHAMVLSLSIGLYGKAPQPMREIAKKLMVSKHEATKIRNEAIDLLKTQLKEQLKPTQETPDV